MRRLGTSSRHIVSGGGGLDGRSLLNLQSWALWTAAKCAHPHFSQWLQSASISSEQLEQRRITLSELASPASWPGRLLSRAFPAAGERLRRRELCLTWLLTHQGSPWNWWKAWCAFSHRRPAASAPYHCTNCEYVYDPIIHTTYYILYTLYYIL